MYRDEEYLRAASEYMGERLRGARMVGVPGTDHLPWEGDQESVLAAIETFFGELGQTVVEPGLILTTVLEAEVPDSEPGLAHSAFSRFRGRELEAPAGRVRASFDGPARAVRCASALAGVVPSLRAGVHTGECELRDDGRLSGAALEIAAGVAGAAQPGQILATSTVRDLVAGSGHGVRRARHRHARRSDDWRVFASSRTARRASQQHQPWVRAVVPKRWRTPETAASRARPEARTSSQWSALGQPASSQRPSGDHSSSESRPGPRRTVSPWMRTSVSSPVRTASASRLPVGA